MNLNVRSLYDVEMMRKSYKSVCGRQLQENLSFKTTTTPKQLSGPTKERKKEMQ